MCFVFISEKREIFVWDKINKLVFLNEVENIYCAVSIGSINKTDKFASFKF
jgi:hypothetical protein